MKKTKKHIKSLINYKDNKEKGRIINPTAEEIAIEHSDPRWPRINGLTNNDLNNFRYGNYYQQILPFYEVFGKENLIFLDGTNIGMIFHERNLYFGPKLTLDYFLVSRKSER